MTTYSATQFVKAIMQRNALILLLLSLVVPALGLSTQAFAMQSPSGIRWGYPPENFVESLYSAVLGRSPESKAVVAAWARWAHTPEGRLQVFWNFVNSREYRSKYGGRAGANEWTIYYKRKRWSTDYTVAKHMPNGYHGVVWGPYNYWIAIALRNYMAQFYDKNYLR